MEIDKTAGNFNSSPLYRFLLTDGKFTGVEFYFKNIEMDQAPSDVMFLDIGFEYESLVEIIEIVVMMES